MKRLILFAFMLVSLQAINQIPRPNLTQLPQKLEFKFYEVTNFMIIDSGLTAPRIDTNWISRWAGTLVREPAGGKLCMSTGVITTWGKHWDVVNSAGGGGSESTTVSSLGGGMDIQAGLVGFDIQIKTLNTADFLESGNLISISNEGLQDDLFTSIVDDMSIDFTYDDGTNQISAKLVNDETTPIDGKFYGKVGGVKGWFTPAGGITTMANIGSSPNVDGALITGNTLTLQPADASNGGVITTGNQNFSGTKSFNSVISGNSSFISSFNKTTSTKYLAGATAAVDMKTYFNATNETITANSNWTTNGFWGDNSVTEAASGTHNIFANVAIDAATLANGVATTTNAASLYIRGTTIGTAAITNNYAMWVDSGLVRIDERIIRGNHLDTVAYLSDVRAGGGGGGGTGSNLSWDVTNHEVDIDGGGTSAIIPFATVSTNGLVSDASQIFDGTKTFRDGLDWQNSSSTIVGGLTFATIGSSLSGGMYLQSGANQGQLFPRELSALRQWYLPDAGGTLVVSVNGNTADVNGNVVITGGGTVTNFIFTDGNGFDGTVTLGTSTPTLSLTTTVSNTQIMFSSSGAITGSASLTWNGANLLITGGIVATTNIAGDVLGSNEVATPGTPAAGKGFFYFKSDNLPYALNDGGTEMPLYNTGTSFTTEDAQDATGAMINASLQYVDGTPLLAIGDRDNGDITVSASGLTWTIDAGAVSLTTDVSGDLPFSSFVQGAANTVVTNPTTGTADFTTTALGASNLLGRGSTGNIAPITVGGILSFSGTVLSATEVDGSVSNELQTINNTSDATSHTVTLSNSGGTIQFIEGTNITLTTGGTGAAGTLTIASTVSGNVTKVGTPVNNQVGVWTGDGTIEGTSSMTFNSNNLTITGGFFGTSIYLSETGSMGTPAAGNGVYYFKLDGLPYAMNDAGTEMALFNTGTSFTTEDAQDATGAMINASLQYVDGTPLLAIGDRDYGNITVTGSGLTWTIDNGAVSNVMLVNSTISGISLGSNLADLTFGYGTTLSSGTTYNGGTAKTVIVDTTIIRDHIYATINVAASNISASTRSYDYVADGIADDVTIQTAIAALPAAGGTIHLSHGVFVFSDSLVIPSNVTLKGAGKTTIIKSDGVSSTTTLIASLATTGVEIKDLTLDGASKVAKYGIMFKNVGSGYGTTTNPGFIIKNIWIKDIFQSGIEMQSCSNGIVTQTNSVNCHFDAIVARTKAGDAAGSKGITISNNVSSGSTAGIWLTGTQEMVVDGNYIEGDYANALGQIGIQIENSKKLVISNNVVKRNVEHNIVVWTSENVLVQGNICDSTEELSGIDVADSRGVNVTGNTISYSAQEGVILGSSDNKASGNYFIGNGHLTNDTYNQLEIWDDSCSIIGNTFRKGVGTNKPKYSLRLTAGAARNIIAENDFDAGGVTGDILYAGSAANNNYQRNNLSNTGIWMTTDTRTFDIGGDLKVFTVANDNLETNLLTWNATDKIAEYRTVASLPGGGLTDTDYGDIVVSGSGTIMTIDAGVIVNADINASAAIAISKLNITGTPDGTKYLRDDGSWQTPSGSGTINSGTTGKPGYYTAATTIDDFIALDYATSGNLVTLTHQNTTDVGFLFQGISSQTGNHITIKNSGATTIGEWTKDGYIKVPGGSPGTGAGSIRMGSSVQIGENAGGYALGIYDANGFNTSIGNGSLFLNNNAATNAIYWGHSSIFGGSTYMSIHGPAANVLQLHIDAANPLPVTIRGNRATATNTDEAGEDFTFESIPGTGNSTSGGSFVFKTPDATGSGTTVQSLTTKLILSRTGFVEMKEISAPGAATSGYARIYVKSDGLWYGTDDAGVETILSGAGGGGSIATLSDVTLTSLATNDFLKYDGADWINRTPANVRTDLGLVIGTNVQAWDADLDTWATLSSANFATLTGTETLSGKTLTAPKYVNGGFIADANGNELLIFTTTASAVNEITISNGATGVNPRWTASGETNVGIDWQVKGTGVYSFLSTSAGPAEVRFYEDTDNGTNYTSFIAPAGLGSNVVITLPSISGTLPTMAQIKQAKGMTLIAPLSGENATIFYTTAAITIEQARAVMIGTSQSITGFTIHYGASRATADGTIVASNTFDSGDGGYQTTGFAHTLNVTSIPAGSYIWFTTTTVSGTISDLNITLTYIQQ